jgi:hypothetical protein
VRAWTRGWRGVIFPHQTLVELGKSDTRQDTKPWLREIISSWHHQDREMFYLPKYRVN